jgi:hypothetical protein
MDQLDLHLQMYQAQDHIKVHSVHSNKKHIPDGSHDTCKINRYTRKQRRHGSINVYLFSDEEQGISVLQFASVHSLLSYDRKAANYRYQYNCIKYGVLLSYR